MYIFEIDPQKYNLIVSREKNPGGSA